jgi:hypothetical protein
MGSNIELNDTLQITTEQGFPADILDLKRHQKNPITLEEVKDKEFEFTKPDERIYHRPPIRNFLVHNINGKWLYWGHVFIIEQTIKEGMTSGKFKIIKIYDPEYQIAMTNNESRRDQSYFKKWDIPLDTR